MKGNETPCEAHIEKTTDGNREKVKSKITLYLPKKINLENHEPFLKLDPNYGKVRNYDTSNKVIPLSQSSLTEDNNKAPISQPNHAENNNIKVPLSQCDPVNNSKTETFECSECNRKFKSKAGRSNHQKKCKQQENKIFVIESKKEAQKISQPSRT